MICNVREGNTRLKSRRHESFTQAMAGLWGTSVAITTYRACESPRTSRLIGALSFAKVSGSFRSIACFPPPKRTATATSQHFVA